MPASKLRPETAQRGVGQDAGLTVSASEHGRQTAASHKGLGRRDRLVPRPRPGFWRQDQGHPARKVKSWDMSGADSASRVLRKRLCGAFLAAQR